MSRASTDSKTCRKWPKLAAPRSGSPTVAVGLGPRWRPRKSSASRSDACCTQRVHATQPRQLHYGRYLHQSPLPRCLQHQRPRALAAAGHAGGLTRQAGGGQASLARRDGYGPLIPWAEAPRLPSNHRFAVPQEVQTPGVVPAAARRHCPERPATRAASRLECIWPVLPGSVTPPNPAGPESATSPQRPNARPRRRCHR